MRIFKTTLSLLLAMTPVVGAYAQDPVVVVSDNHLAGPPAPAQFQSWLRDMKRWRVEELRRIGYDGAEYARPELQWTQSSFMQPQMMIEDRYFYDPVAGKYTVDRYLDDLEKRYGGIDAVLVWPTYPNIGIDNRNQFDMFRDMPGGIAGIKQMVDAFHRRGVKVLFPVMMWDEGTREPEKPEAEMLSEELAAVGADGVNGDTMIAVPRSFRIASDKTNHPLAFEPEHLRVEEPLAYNNLSWGQATLTPQETLALKLQLGISAPELVDKFKWMEPRHLTNISDRWQRNKIEDLQYAFFNGVGMETWENIWGIWNGMTLRDSEAVRRIAKVDRKFSSLLISPDWEPHTPTLQYQVYASKWPGKDQTLWTLVNKNEFDVDGEQLELKAQVGMHYYDLWHGTELKPEVRGDKSVLHFNMEANGFGAVLATAAPAADLQPFLREMQQLSRTRLDSFSAEWKVLKQTLVEIKPTKPAASAPAGMVKIPAAPFTFKVDGVEIEGGNQVGVDVQYPWEQAPARHHVHSMQIASFYIDKYPVTNAEFKKFLDSTHYRPKDDHNFLHDWKDGNYPEGWGNKPVTWVSMEDARAYAAWAGKRLPHEWEWQYAAQGHDDRAYPWGNSWDASLVQAVDRGHALQQPEDVNAHPGGASPFGVEDTTGSIWQWTDEYQDEHTRAGILRGGSYYRPQGSRWYFPQAYALHEHGKLLLMSPGRDRAATIGFRCVEDAQ